MDGYGFKLKQILTASGWSQEALAGKLGVSFATLNSWVNDKSTPRDAARERIDVIFAEVMGDDAVDKARLKLAKAEAVSHKCTAKKIANNREILEKITTSLIYHSNATEGSTMTERDVHAVIFDNQQLRNRTAIEQREAINHQTAMYFLLDELVVERGNFRFTPELVQAVHLRMMNGIVSDAGLWRNHSVRVSGSYAPRANFIKLPELMGNWCNAVNEETADPIELMARSHAEFEKIHPFSDGNGRTGRLLLFALALKLGLVPPVLRKERRNAYYRYLELAHTRDVTDPLEMFIAEAINAVAREIE